MKCYKFLILLTKFQILQNFFPFLQNLLHTLSWLCFYTIINFIIWLAFIADGHWHVIEKMHQQQKLCLLCHCAAIGKDNGDRSTVEPNDHQADLITKDIFYHMIPVFWPWLPPVAGQSTEDLPSRRVTGPSILATGPVCHWRGGWCSGSIGR